MFRFPDFNPVAISLGPFHIRWYALAYLAGFVFGWVYAIYLTRLGPQKRPTRQELDDFLSWAVLAVILGGRLGYVFFYQLAYYVAHPIEIFEVWHGGMSFHGGLIGVTLALLIFSWRRKLSPFRLGDIVASVGPIGFFFGRIANFVNGELYGRVTDVPWGVVFPGAGPEPRHPSQLYEAGLEGILLFIILALLAHRPNVRAREGFLAGNFFVGYGLCRIFAELFRAPDIQIGYLWGGVTMGQLLSVPMVIFGLWLIIRAWMRSPEVIYKDDTL